MPNIFFSNKVRSRILLYIDTYLKYYIELYKDSGIWSQNSILAGYEQESLKRYTEIFNLIENKLSNSIITYPNNKTTIRWRSKILIVYFKDNGDMRIITDLEIQ